MNELFTTMKTLWETFEANHNEYGVKQNKAAAARARKAINELKKHVTNYKKASMEEVKKG